MCVCVFVHDILGIIRLTRFPFSAFPWSSQRFQSVGRMVEWRTRAHNSTFTARYIIHMQFVLIVPHAILNSILSPSFVSSHFNHFFSYRSYSLSLSQSKFLIPVSISFTPVAFPLSNRIISAHLADACISMSDCSCEQMLIYRCVYISLVIYDCDCDYRLTIAIVILQLQIKFHEIYWMCIYAIAREWQWRDANESKAKTWSNFQFTTVQYRGRRSVTSLFYLDSFLIWNQLDGAFENDSIRFAHKMGPFVYINQIRRLIQLAPNISMDIWNVEIMVKIDSLDHNRNGNTLLALKLEWAISIPRIVQIDFSIFISFLTVTSWHKRKCAISDHRPIALQ